MKTNKDVKKRQEPESLDCFELLFTCSCGYQQTVSDDGFSDFKCHECGRKWKIEISWILQEQPDAGK